MRCGDMKLSVRPGGVQTIRDRTRMRSNKAQKLDARKYNDVIVFVAWKGFRIKLIPITAMQSGNLCDSTRDILQDT
jgi:hypothetical protein